MYTLGITQDNQYRILKPDRSVLLNWLHPLTRYLAFYTNFAQCLTTDGSNASLVFDHISRSTKFPSSNTIVTSKTGDLGVALNFSGASNSLVTWNVDTAVAALQFLRQISVTNNPLSIGIKFRTTTNPGAGVQMAGLTGSGFDKWLIGVNVGGALAFDIRDGLGTATTTGTYIDGAWYTVFGTHTPAGQEVIAVYDQYGIRKERVAATAGDYTSGGATCNFAIGANSANSSNFTGQVEWCGVWALRVLSDLEMQQLAANPYQILNAPAYKRRWYNAPAGVAATTFIPLVGGPSGAAGLSLASVGGGLAG